MGTNLKKHLIVDKLEALIFYLHKGEVKFTGTGRFDSSNRSIK